MTATVQDNRTRWPELAQFVDAVRASGATPAAMWVEDEDGIVLAGRRPPVDHRQVELDADGVVMAAERYMERCAMESPTRNRQANQPKTKRK